MRILSCTVPPEAEGRMVKGILRSELQLSYTLLKSLKWRENAILLNGRSVHVNVRVHAGDTVSVALEERAPRAPLCCAGAEAPDIVYEDDDLLVLNKPAGVAMHPKSGDVSAPSLAAMLTAYLGAGSVPHFVSRLDKGTSGLLIAAKNGHIHDRLRRALHSDALCREYRAIAIGSVAPPAGVIDAPIARKESSCLERVVDFTNGERAVTHYQVLKTTELYSLVALQLETGRTHQIRVHMSYLGYSLVGDFLYNPKYAGNQIDRVTDAQTKEKTADYPIHRQALHAHKISFPHPMTGEHMEFCVPMPEDMLRLV